MRVKTSAGLLSCGRIRRINEEHRVRSGGILSHDLDTISLDEGDPVPHFRNRSDTFFERLRVPSRLDTLAVLTVFEHHAAVRQNPTAIDAVFQNSLKCFLL